MVIQAKCIGNPLGKQASGVVFEWRCLGHDIPINIGDGRSGGGRCEMCPRIRSLFGAVCFAASWGGGETTRFCPCPKFNTSKEWRYVSLSDGLTGIPKRGLRPKGRNAGASIPTMSITSKFVHFWKGSPFSKHHVSGQGRSPNDNFPHPPATFHDCQTETSNWHVVNCEGINDFDWLFAHVYFKIGSEMIQVFEFPSLSSMWVRVSS